MIDASDARQTKENWRVTKFMGKKTSALTAKIDSMNLVMAEVREDLKSLQEEMTYTLQKFSLPSEEHAKCVQSIGKMRKKLRGAMTETGDTTKSKKGS